MSNKTEIILYRDEILEDPYFFLDSEWGFTGIWTIGSGSAIKSAGFAGTIYQNGILKNSGYRLTFKINSITAGTVKIITGTTVHATYTTNGFKELFFTADDPDFIVEGSSTCDAALVNFHLTEDPEQYVLDIFDDTSIPFNFNIDDIFNPKDRKTTFTKTVELPGTNNNNQAFGAIYKINSESIFSPFKKTRCVVKNSGIVLLDGYLSLDNVVKQVKDKIENITYQVTLYGEGVNIYQKLGNLKIKDLDFSAYDHDLSLLNIYRTWPSKTSGGGISSGMSYIMQGGSPVAAQTILYTFPALTAVNSYALNGFNWVELEFTSNHSGIAVGDHIFVDDSPGGNMTGDFTVVEVSGADTIVIDAAFATTSWSGVLGSIEVTKREWKSIGYFYPLADSGQFSELVRYSDGVNLKQNRLYTIEYLDANDDLSGICFDPVTSTLMTPAVGVTFQASDGTSADDLPISQSSTSAVQITSGTLTVGTLYKIVSYVANDDFSNVGGYPPSGASGTWDGYYFFANYTTPLDWTGASTLEFQQVTQLFSWSGSVFSTYVPRSLGGKLIKNKNNTANHWYVEDFIPHIYVREVWAKMFAKIGYYYDAPFIDTNLFRRLIMPLDMKFNVNDASYFGTTGYTVNMNDWLPDMKLSEFFLSILNMFNLVLIEDKDIKNLVKIVERNNFFNGDKKTLTLNVDTPLTIQMAASLVAKQYNFRYKTGPDYYNQLYNQEFGQVSDPKREYGDRIVITENELSKEEKDNEIAFVPTVPVGLLSTVPGNYQYYNPGYGQDKVFSAYFSGSDSTFSRPLANRILIAGVRGCLEPWSLTTATPSTGSNPENQMDVKVGKFVSRAYGYATHFDNIMPPYPINDLNFDTALGRYFDSFPAFDTTYWRENALVGKHWVRFMRDLISKDSKLISGDFLFKVRDIYELDFQDEYICEDISLRLRKIIDWDLNGDGLCKCEFLLKNY